MSDQQPQDGQAPGAQTISVHLDELSLDQLVQLSQGFGRQIDELREKRAYLKRKIDERLANGERDAPPPGDAVAPGALIEAGVAAG